MKPRPLSEKAITGAVVQHWLTLGLPNTLVASIPNAGAFGQAGLTPGLPDLLVLGPSVPGRIGFIELKNTTGKLSPPQEEFKARCIALGLSHAVTYGRDEPIYVLECWGVVRSASCQISTGPQDAAAGSFAEPT